MSTTSPPPSFPDIGSLVEVTSKDEGFQSISFGATVIANLRVHENKQTLRVQYHDLLASGEGTDTEPLVEDVEISHIQPLPPVEELGLDDLSPGDAVDAFNQDGWWTGVVTGGVVGPGKRRYTVKFEDQVGIGDFVVAKIRIHWDWHLANQTWSRLAKQVELESLSQVGRKIEVSRDGENPHCSWFEASVLECLSDGSVLVEYATLKDTDGQHLKTTVKPLDGRPCPPRIKVKSFLLSDDVDVYYGFGWFTGVITEVLVGGRYAVRFMQKESNQVFYDSDLRPHLKWKDGKWLAFTRGVTLSEAGVPCSKRKRGKPPKKQQVDGIPVQKLKVEEFPGTQLSSAKRRGRKPPQVEESTNTPGPRRKTRQLTMLEVAKQVPELPCNEIVEQPLTELIEGVSCAVPNAVQSTENIQETPKSCPAWENVGNLGVLEWIQQQPQMLHLELGKEIPRQTAETIGLLVCFRSLVQTVLDNPSNFKTDVLGGLPQYAKLGLDVRVLQDSVTKLLESRSERLNVENETRVIDQQISVHNDEKCRIDREISETNKEMKMLQEKLSKAKLAKENKDSTISALQVKLQEAKEIIADMDNQMQGVATSVWKHYFS